MYIQISLFIELIAKEARVNYSSKKAIKVKTKENNDKETDTTDTTDTTKTE